MNPLVGSLLPRAERDFGEYELVSKLAMGGMAEILLARRKDDEDGKLLVVKRVLSHLQDESRFIAMFRDEGRLAAQIVHPNVCRVYDSGAVDNTYYIAMEYLHGIPLSRMLIRAARTRKPVDVHIVVGIVIQCAHGLHHAHELTSRDGRPLDVVHRDVSPPNILVTTEGVAKMLDFGVAKARGATQKTRTGTVKGKNSYMSPEQILGQAVDRRSDVFSLGIVLWEALTSKRLFSKDTDFLTFTAITKTEIPDVQRLRPDVSNELAAVLGKALAQNREDRYSTAREFADALAAAVGNEQADEQAIADYVQLAFSKDLADRDALTANVSEQLAALDAEEERATTGEKSHRIRRQTTQPLMQQEIQLALVEADEVAPSMPKEAAPTVDVEPLVARSRSRTVPAVIFASVVTAAVVFFLSRGSGSSDPADAPEVEAAHQTTPVVSPSAVEMGGSDAGVAVHGTADAAIRTSKSNRDVDNRPAYLTVDSAPWATIYVDGKKLGVTPIFKAKLSPGSHKLRAVSATGAKKHMNLMLKPGRTKNLGRLHW